MRARRTLGALLGVAAALIVYADASAQFVMRRQFSPDAPRIRLELVDTDIRDALRLVARQGDVNIVMSNKVTGAVTLELADARQRRSSRDP